MTAPKISIGNQIREILTVIDKLERDPKWMNAAMVSKSVRAYQLATLRAAIDTLEWVVKEREFIKWAFANQTRLQKQMESEQTTP